VLQEKEDEAEMQSPTGDLCADYLPADERWTSKLGVGSGGFKLVVREVVGIEEGARQEVMKSSPPPPPLRAAARPISLPISARAAKDWLLHQLRTSCE
jgi:hypothetical protein